MKSLIGAKAAAVWACLASLSSAGLDVDGNPVLALGDSVPIDTPKTYWTELHRCPASCANLKSERWTVYPSVERLKRCDQPLLFDFAIYTPVQSGGSTKVRACTLGDVDGDSSEAEEEEEKKADKRASPICLSTASESKSTLQLGRQGSADSKADETIAALEHLRTRFGEEASCDASVLFGYANGTFAGVYVGSAFSKASASSVLEGIIANVKADGSSTSMTSQLCSDERNANHVLGVAIDTTGDLAKVQEKVVSWAEGKCVSDVGSTVSLKDLSIWEDESEPVMRNNGTKVPRNLQNLHKRADCETITVVADDSCAALAARCGLTPAEFTKLHPESGFCASLQPEQRVCCTEGDLPDIRPKPNPDGSCASYLVIPDDNCSKLAAKNGLTNEDIEKFNNGTTWGWTGCKGLMAGINICLSKGDPPMPAPVENAVCGPTKPGSKRPTDGTKLEDINPCPLNACCNIWGQCGISGEFCIKKDGPSGNPGTAPPGFNGCVSSCGMDIVNKDQSSGSYDRIGYYETWNFNRPCLNMRVNNANTDGSYTHIHWAFAEIDPSDWSVKIVDEYNQWEDFKSMAGVKRIISFGGWGYSTEPETYNILRQAMAPENRDTFGWNVAEFINNEGLDGVDFDWEYPGAPDIPGTPPGLPTDGPNYLKFLTAMRNKLPRGPDGKSLSIAAPASYWYLKAFPIDKMADVIDYIVYMTYDLHGQWDAGNEWSSEGCLEGNCLRSHVNLTETVTALSMVTKAGVPTYKLFVGESSYGRSFKMSQAGCTGPECTFLGDRLNSPAAKGRCTDTSGYISNAEIEEIINFGDAAEAWHDGDSNSDILVYDDTEWVAYMTLDTRNTRREMWQGYNFAGTIDWAVDLQTFTDDDWYGPDGKGKPDEPRREPLSECTGEYGSLDDIPGDAPNHCRNLYILQALRKTLGDSLKQYDDLIGGGYDKKFDSYASAVAKSGNKQVENFMYTKGKDYFDCVVTERIGCCSWCHATYDDEKHCRYCEDYDCGYSSICDNPEVICPEIEFRYKEFDMACPPDFSERSEDEPRYDWGEYAMASVKWTLRDDRKDAFWGDLYLETGIDEENIEWKSVERYPCIPAESKEECNKHDHDHNFPVTHDYNKDDVLDPKDVVEDAHKNLQGLGPQIDDVIKAMKDGTFFGSGYDVVDAVALPITMVDDAVDNMQTIDDTVDKWNEEKRKNIILAFLSAVFFFVPVIGEVLAAVTTLANVARIVALVGAAGNTALGIYDIVDDPANAPLAIFGIILEPLALMDVAKMTKAAAARRMMSPEDIAKLGAKPGGKINKIEDLKNVCVLPKAKRDLPMGALPMSSLTGRQYDLMDGML